VGMKAEVTLSPRAVFTRANLSAGLSTGMLNPSIYPSLTENLSYVL